MGGTAALLRGMDADARPYANDTPRGAGGPSHEDVPLLADDKAQGLRNRWQACQREFVDEPRRSVEQADGLVADLITELAQQFARERTQLEGQWSKGEEVSTDELRFTLQRYRSFFNRLLKV